MGRSIYCYDCKQVKERQDYGYCNACRRKRDNANRIAKGITKKHQTGKCQCGNDRASYSNVYCVECIASKAKQRRNEKPLTREQKNKVNERLRRKRAENKRPGNPATEQDRVKYRQLSLSGDEKIIKHRVRALTRSFIKAGKLIRQPCEVCNTVERVEAHHDDYEKPMEIRWLCHKHHMEYHRTQNSILRG